MLSRAKRSLATPLLALVLALSASLLVLVPAPAQAAEGTEASGGTAAIHYEDEQLAQFEAQLAAHEIRSVTINRRLRSLRITLTDGRHVLAHYKAKEGPRVRAALSAQHVPVIVLSSAQVNSELKKAPVHHKLRYIAGGVLIAVIVIVGGFLLYRRRRRASEE